MERDEKDSPPGFMIASPARQRPQREREED
jgi:hypothetical protein